IRAYPRGPIEEIQHGSKIFQGGIEEGRTRDARAQARNAEKRPQRKEGEKPQAGDRDRAFRSAQGRQESPEEEEKEGRTPEVKEEELRQHSASFPRKQPLP